MVPYYIIKNSSYNHNNILHFYNEIIIVRRNTKIKISIKRDFCFPLYKVDNKIINRKRITQRWTRVQSIYIYIFFLFWKHTLPGPRKTRTFYNNIILYCHRSYIIFILFPSVAQIFSK